MIIDIACLPQGSTWFSNITSRGSCLIFVLFSELRLEVIVRFDDIGGIVDLTTDYYFGIGKWILYIDLTILIYKRWMTSH